MPEPTETPEYTQTLNDLLSTAAADWAPTDREAIVKALRAQRERWNQEQAIGSRKRVTSKQVGVKTTTPAGVAVRKGGKKLNLSGLKL